MKGIKGSKNCLAAAILNAMLSVCNAIYAYSLDNAIEETSDAPYPHPYPYPSIPKPIPVRHDS